MMRSTLWALALVACGDVAPGPDDADAPTWYGEVGPLVVERCGACHREGGIAPFSVQTFEEAAPWAAAMADAVREGRMPPFAATRSDECQPEVWYKDDHRLTGEELALLEAWIDAGTLEGEGSGALPVPSSGDLEDPDAVLALQQPFTVPAEGEDRYQCFRIPLDFEEDTWVTGVQVLPDNDRVVHHVLVWTDPQDQSAGRVDADGSYACSGTPDFYPTELLAAWTPGAPPAISPEGTGALVKAGASLVVNVHYHPSGVEEQDQTQIALEWTREQPEQYTTWFLVDLPFGAEVQPGPNDPGENPVFRIPAGVSDHVETLVLDTGTYLPFSLPIFAVAPHMHYLGTDMRVIIRREDPADDECLVQAEDYRFDFQTSYVLDAPVDDLPTIHPGDRLEVRCTYDNSMSNPNIEAALAASGASEPVDVTWGEETGDEMCMAMVGLVIPPIDLSELY